MTLTDRDQKMILILLIVAVILLPYTFYSKDTRADTETQKAKNLELQTRLEQLQEMNKNRDFYISETARMQKERDELIASFPGGIRQENYTEWLLYMETNSILKTAETYAQYAEEEEERRAKKEEDPEWEPPEDEIIYPRFGYKDIDGNAMVLVTEVAYGVDDEVAITSEEDESADPLVGRINASKLKFFCYYEGMKYILDYILNFEDPMTYPTVKLKFDPESAIIEGEMVLDQFAISGQGRSEERDPVWPDLDELDLRGNELDGIFGPLDKEALYNRQVYEAYLQDLKNQLLELQKAAEEDEEDDDKDKKKDDKKDDKK